MSFHIHGNGVGGFEHGQSAVGFTALEIMQAVTLTARGTQVPAGISTA